MCTDRNTPLEKIADWRVFKKVALGVTTEIQTANSYVSGVAVCVVAGEIAGDLFRMAELGKCT
jgi:hypothetical protein